MTVLKYLVGVVLLFGVGAFLIRTLKSFIDQIREWSNKKKSSADGKTESASSDTGAVEKEVHKD